MYMQTSMTMKKARCLMGDEDAFTMCVGEIAHLAIICFKMNIMLYGTYQQTLS